MADDGATWLWLVSRFKNLRAVLAELDRVARLPRTDEQAPADVDWVDPAGGPRAIHYAAVLTLWTEIEMVLQGLCAKAHHRLHLRLSVEDLAGRNERQRAMAYLEKIVGIPPAKNKFGSRVAHLQRVRNVIAHHAGRFPRHLTRSDCNLVQALLTNMLPGISVEPPDHRLIIVSHGAVVSLADDVVGYLEVVAQSVIDTISES